MIKLLSLSFVLASLLAVSSCIATKSASTLEKPDFAQRIPGFPSAEFWYASNSNIPLVSAHRGKPELLGYPENALESFNRLISEGSFIAEIDIAMSKDSVLFLFHDDRLERLTTHQGLASERLWSDLDTMRLRDEEGTLTRYTIPTLKEVLLAGKGKALYTLDRKKGVSYALIQQEVLDVGMIDDVALILYNLTDFEEWSELDQHGAISMDGSSVGLLERQAKESRMLYKSSGIPSLKGRDRIPAMAFTGVGLPPKQVLAKAETLRIKCITGTFGELDENAQVSLGETYRELVASGVSIITTNRPLAAYAALLDLSAPKPKPEKTLSEKEQMMQKNKGLTRETVPAVVE